MTTSQNNFILVEVESVEDTDLSASVIRFTGTTDDGSTVTFGVDHRSAFFLLQALQGDEPVHAALEAWQILSTEVAV